MDSETHTWTDHCHICDGFCLDGMPIDPVKVSVTKKICPVCGKSFKNVNLHRIKIKH